VSAVQARHFALLFDQISHIHARSTGTTWLVALDESENSECVFGFALQKMDRKKDSLVLLIVAGWVLPTFGFPEMLDKSDDLLDAQHSLDDHSKSVLRRHWAVAREHGVINVLLYLCNSNNPGAAICRSAEDTKTDCICIGRRGLGMVEWPLLGYVPRYGVDNASYDGA
jgi:nucleotide-binding universal stress UspA family protein